MNNPSVKDLVNEKGVMLLSDMEKVVDYLENIPLIIANVKTTCFSQYSGKDEVLVVRDGAAFYYLL